MRQQLQSTSKSPSMYTRKALNKLQNKTPSPQAMKRKVTYATEQQLCKNTLENEVEYWKNKYLELESVCGGKASYQRLEQDLELWKSKYQQLQIRYPNIIIKARVAKGSELIIEEYQNRIVELTRQLYEQTTMPNVQNVQSGQNAQKNYYSSVHNNVSVPTPPNNVKEYLDKIREQQNQIYGLEQELSRQKQLMEENERKQLELSDTMFIQTNLHETRKLQRQKSTEETNKQLQDQIQQMQKEYREQLKKLKDKDKESYDQSLISYKQQIQKQLEELNAWKDKYKELERVHRQELSKKDEHYHQIISQLKSQLNNQIQSGEMRLTTLQSILKEQQQRQNSCQLQHSTLQRQGESDQVLIRLDSELTNLKQLVNDKHQYP